MKRIFAAVPRPLKPLVGLAVVLTLPIWIWPVVLYMLGEVGWGLVSDEPHY